MANKYLDFDGLNTLWEKIKTRITTQISGKQEACEILEDEPETPVKNKLYFVNQPMLDSSITKSFTELKPLPNSQNSEIVDFYYFPSKIQNLNAGDTIVFVVRVNNTEADTMYDEEHMSFTPVILRKTNNKLSIVESANYGEYGNNGLISSDKPVKSFIENIGNLGNYEYYLGILPYTQVSLDNSNSEYYNLTYEIFKNDDKSIFTVNDNNELINISPNLNKIVLLENRIILLEEKIKLLQ